MPQQNFIKNLLSITFVIVLAMPTGMVMGMMEVDTIGYILLILRAGFFSLAHASRAWQAKSSTVAANQRESARVSSPH